MANDKNFHRICTLGVATKGLERGHVKDNKAKKRSAYDRSWPSISFGQLADL